MDDTKTKIVVKEKTSKLNVNCPLCGGEMKFDRSAFLRSRDGFLSYDRFIHKHISPQNCEILDVRLCKKGEVK